MDRCAERNGEGCNGVGDAVLLCLTQSDRDSRRGRRGAECRQVGGHHGEQRLDRVLLADCASNDVLREQDDDLKQEDDDNNADQGAHNVPRLTGVGEVQEDTKDVQGQQRDDDALDELGNDGAEFNEALTHNATWDHCKSDADHEGEQQRGHNRDSRRHFDGEERFECRAGLGNISKTVRKELREDGCCDQVGQEACEESRGVGQRGGNAEPLARATSKISNSRSDQADDDERNREGQELAEDG